MFSNNTVIFSTSVTLKETWKYVIRYGIVIDLEEHYCYTLICINGITHLVLQGLQMHKVMTKGNFERFQLLCLEKSLLFPILFTGRWSFGSYWGAHTCCLYVLIHSVVLLIAWWCFAWLLAYIRYLMPWVQVAWVNMLYIFIFKWLSSWLC